ncbi:MAG: DUF1565 domain-containing protein [Kiritimatiellia bacterium]
MNRSTNPAVSVKRIFLASIALISLAAFTASAADVYVSGTGSDLGDGSAASPYRTLAKAVAAAGAGGTVHVGEGSYDIASGETFPIAVTANLSIVGWSAGGGVPDRTARVITGGNSAANLFDVSSGVAFAVADCVLRDTSHALVLMETASIAATNVLFTQSAAASGTGNYNDPANFNVGAIRARYSCTMVFKDCAFASMSRDAMILDYGTPQTDFFTVRMDDCLVADNTVKFGNIVEGTGCKVDAKVNNTVFRNNAITSTGGQHDAFGGSVFWTRGAHNSKSATHFTFDRCRFLGNGGRSLFGLNNANLVRITNSLFADNNTTGYTIGGHAIAVQIWNCTILGGGGGFAGRNAVTQIRNSILDGVPNLQQSVGWTSYADNLTILDSIVHDCTLGVGVNANSAYSTEDPALGNVAVAYDDDAFDPRPLPYSPGIDASAAAAVAGAIDLDGNARVADNDADGTAVADYGCYESLFHAAVSPTFLVPVPGLKYAIRGQTITIPVSIDPGASIAGPVTAAVTYPDGITGSATLSFADGSASANLQFTVNSDAPDGTLRIAIAESGTSQGVLPAFYDVIAADLTLTTGGSHFYLKEGDTLDLTVSLSAAGAVTPSAITVTTGVTAGDGSSAAAWQGGATIATNTSATPGALHIVGGFGVNTVDLSLSAGTFVESGAPSLTLTIVGHDGTLHADAVNGNDATATGLAGGMPFRTATAALSKLADGTVRLAPGTYSSATGEAFPLEPGAVHIEGASPDTTILDAGNAADSVVAYAAGERGSLANLALRNSKNAALYLFGADCAATNCAFTQSTASETNPGGLWARENSRVEAVGCVFTNMTRRAAAYATQLSLATSGDRRVTLVDCLFENNSSFYGAVATFPASWYAWNLTNCVFRTNTTQKKNHIHDSYAASCIWVEIGTHGTRNRLDADRCRFLGNTGNHVIAGDHSTLHFTSCLLAGNVPTTSMLRGYSFSPYFRNCTFAGNGTGLYAGDNSNFECCFYNSIFVNDGPLSAAGGAAKVRLSRCILGNTALGGGFTEIDLGTVVVADPILENPSVAWDNPAFDARPRPYSPAIDAASSDAYRSAWDLDGHARIADNNDDGIAAADLGCYESTFHASAIPMFFLPLPGKGSAFRGSTTVLPVSIDPPAATYPVTAAVSYGTGLSGTNTLVFADAATTNNLVVTVAADAPASARVAFADAANPAGVAPASFDFTLGDLSLTVGGSTTINVREGATLDIPVSIGLADTVAPDAISIGVGSVLGTGTSTIAWQGDALIPAGAAISSGALHIVGGTGVNEITLTGDFDFTETDAPQVVLTIVAYPGYLYADSTNGSDATGTGLANAPFATIGHAISRLSKGDEVRVLPGVYSEETGEVFPLEPFGVAVRGWSGGGDADPSTVIIDGTNGVLNLLTYSYGDGAYTGLVANVAFRDSKEAAVLVDSAAAAIRNCRFTQSLAGGNNYRLSFAGGVSVRDACDADIDGCVFDGIQRLSALQVDSTTQQRDGSQVRVSSCLFTNCVSSLGTLAIYRAGGSLFVTNCTFAANDTPAVRPDGPKPPTLPRQRARLHGRLRGLLLRDGLRRHQLDPGGPHRPLPLPRQHRQRPPRHRVCRRHAAHPELPLRRQRAALRDGQRIFLHPALLELHLRPQRRELRRPQRGHDVQLDLLRERPHRHELPRRPPRGNRGHHPLEQHRPRNARRRSRPRRLRGRSHRRRPPAAQASARPKPPSSGRIPPSMPASA